MKSLSNITLVNGPDEIYKLFTQLYPELVLQVKEWHQWGKYTDNRRGLVIHLYNESKLLFSIVKFEGDEEGWTTPGCYMVPSYVEEIPKEVAFSSPAKDINIEDNPDVLLDCFCQMFPGFQSEIIGLRIWRRFDETFRGIMIDLRDRKRVLFAAEKNNYHWDAKYPILVPSPDEDDVPTTEIERIIMSDIVIFQ